MSDIFLDTANMEDIKEIKSWGIIQGVTTNQKIFLNIQFLHLVLLL